MFLRTSYCSLPTLQHLCSLKVLCVSCICGDWGEAQAASLGQDTNPRLAEWAWTVCPFAGRRPARWSCVPLCWRKTFYYHCDNRSVGLQCRILYLSWM